MIGRLTRRRRCPAPPSARSGLTLVELLITIALLGVVIGVLVPRIENSIPDQLNGAVHAIVSDLQYARDLAVTNGSTYRVTFDSATNRFELTHRGGNAALNELPPSDFLNDTVAADGTPAQVFSLDDLPTSGMAVRIHGVTRQAAEVSPPMIEFDSLGQTTAPVETTIWLRAGSGGEMRFQPIHVSPITGLVRTGALTAAAPQGIPAPNAVAVP